MIAAAAVVPEAPLLVPELAGDAGREVVALREATVRAARWLAARAARWTVVGTDPRSEARTASEGLVERPGGAGTFAGFGADVVVRLDDLDPPGSPDRSMALPLLLAGWLRGQVLRAEPAATVEIDALLLAPGTSATESLDAGRALEADSRRRGLLVVADGAATLGVRAPGAVDPRAGHYDVAIADALDRGCAPTLAALDPGLADELLVGGRVPWQVLAGAVPSPRSARQYHHSAPFGVAYHVATWTAGRPGHRPAGPERSEPA